MNLKPMNTSEHSKILEHHTISELINSHPIMLFMKGSPEYPLCGFSKTVVEILKSYAVDFGFFDVLGDDMVREEIKVFSPLAYFPSTLCEGNFDWRL